MDWSSNKVISRTRLSEPEDFITTPPIDSVVNHIEPMVGIKGVVAYVGTNSGLYAVLSGNTLVKYPLAESKTTCKLC